MDHSIKIPVIVILFIGSIICLTSCKEKTTPPVVTTTNVTGITQTTATAGGNVTSDGNAEATSRGVCWNTSENPTLANSKTSDGTGTGSFTSSLTQLIPNTKYYVKAYATNSAGTGYGSQVSFTSNPILLATLTTTAVTSITSTTAVSGGNITADGGGSVTARGVCWGTTANPTTSNNKTTDGSGTGSFTSNITGLIANTTYYVRAYATNSVGAAYGNEISFTSQQLKDADGNVYTSITIGTQTWMVENLKTTKFNDNTAIPLVTDNAAWNNLTTPGYCWQNNDIANKTTYGALYNFYAVNTGKLCPTGWHVPSDAEWTTLTTYLGGYTVAGGKLKETGTTHWLSPNTGATNESGFTALPGGSRNYTYAFYAFGHFGFWWTSSESMTIDARDRYLRYDSNEILGSFSFKCNGESVRCLKD
jgi:uncharacterized protein (TIGR02145 family)